MGTGIAGLTYTHPRLPSELLNFSLYNTSIGLGTSFPWFGRLRCNGRPAFAPNPPHYCRYLEFDARGAVRYVLDWKLGEEEPEYCEGLFWGRLRGLWRRVGM